MKKNKNFFNILSVTLILVFMTSLVNTVNVFADDATPPDATEEPALPAETEVSTSAPEAQATEETVVEILASAPEGVDVVVLDDAGEAVPLAAQEAVQIILDGDPIWCPNDLDGTPQDNPVAGSGGCTTSFTTFTALLTELNTNPYSSATGGTIFVAYDYSAAEGLVTFDGSDADLVNLGNLTIQGGWDFGSGGMHNGDSTYQSTLTGTWLEINNWVGNVTINNLFIADANGTGLTVLNTGDVTFNEVTVDDSDEIGANIYTTGDVNITNSEFTNNGVEGYTDGTTYYAPTNGLYIGDSNSITLNNVVVSNNGGDGADLYAANDINITNSVFNNNGWGEGYGQWLYLENISATVESYNLIHIGGDGLLAEAGGDITIIDSVANYNAGYGADLESEGDIFISNSEFSENGDLSYTGIGNYYFDDGTASYAYFSVISLSRDGLYADAEGQVTLNDVQASYNAGDGAELYADTGAILITNSAFNENGFGGEFFNGMCDGGFCGYDLLEEFLLDNTDNTAYCEVASYTPLVFDPCTDPTYIIVQGSQFSFSINTDLDASQNNQSYSIYYSGGLGLYAESDDSTVTLNNVVANNNGGGGAYLNGELDVSITDSEFNSNGYMGYFNVGESARVDVDSEFVGGGFSYSGGTGLYAYSDENVTLQSVVANFNAYDGAEVNSYGSIFVSDSAFIENGFPILIGGEGGLLGYFLYDTIGLDNTIALPTSYLGFELGLYSGDEEGIILELDLASGSGLVAEADGNVTLTNVTAIDNLGNGAYANSEANIFVSGSTFTGNGEGFSGGLELALGNFDDVDNGLYLSLFNGSGLEAIASADIIIDDVYASDNTLHGALLYSGATDSVFVSNSQFSNNGYSSDLFGLGLNNGFGIFFAIDQNGIDGQEVLGSGLNITSNGNVTLDYVTANDNYWNGAEIYSDNGAVVVNCGQYNNNGYFGIEEFDASSLTLNGVEITGNSQPDEYFFSNSLVVNDDCLPTGGSSTANTGGGISCPEGDSKTFMLDNKDYAVFPCPINDIASASILPEDKLPAPLPDTKPNEAGGEYLYISGLETFLYQDGKYVDINQESMLVSFLIPEGTDPETLTILYWDGSEWKDLGGEVSEIGPNGEKEEGKLYFQVSTQFVGAFVLAQKP